MWRFRCSMEEILERQLLTRGRAFAKLLQLKKLSRAARKGLYVVQASFTPRNLSDVGLNSSTQTAPGQKCCGHITSMAIFCQKCCNQITFMVMSCQQGCSHSTFLVIHVFWQSSSSFLLPNYSAILSKKWFSILLSACRGPFGVFCTSFTFNTNQYKIIFEFSHMTGPDMTHM